MSPGCKLVAIGRCVHHKDAIISCHVIKQYEFHLGFVNFNSFTVNLSYLFIAAPFLTFSPQTIWDCQSCFFPKLLWELTFTSWISVADTSAPTHNQFFPLSHVWEAVGPLWSLVLFAKSHQHWLTNTLHLTKWQLGTVAQQTSFITIFPIPLGATTHKASWQTSCVYVGVFIGIKYRDTSIKPTGRGWPLFSHWCTCVLREKAWFLFILKKGRIKWPPWSWKA